MIQGRLCVRYHVEIQRVMRSCPCLKKFMRGEAGSGHCLKTQFIWVQGNPTLNQVAECMGKEGQ